MRGRRVPVRALLIGAGLLPALAPSAASAQGQARPLDPEHWSYALIRELDMASWPGAWMVRSRPVPGGVALDGLRADGDGSSGDAALASLAAAWADRLRGETGGSSPGLQVGLGVGVDHSDAEVVPSRGGFGRGLVDATLSPRLSLWADGVVSTERGASELRSGGVSVTARGVQLLVGRIQPAVRTGLNAVLLNGSVGLDGLMVASRTPFRMPGGLSRLGLFQAHFFLAPTHETPTVQDAWFTSYGVGWSPIPSLSFGVARTIRFGGEGLAPFTASNLWNMVAFGGGNSSFDDSQGEISMRARVKVGGLRLGLYGALAFEDLVAIKEDPALMAGFSVPVPTAAGLFTVGYEFLGIGPRGIWCGCEAVSHSWYTQREYGPYTADGDILGAALGGYGAGHYVSGSFWSTPYPIYVRGQLFLEDRSERNLLNSRWPNERTGARIEVGLGPWRGVRGSVGVVTTSTEGGRENGFEVSLHAVDVLSLLGEMSAVGGR